MRWSILGCTLLLLALAAVPAAAQNCISWNCYFDGNGCASCGTYYYNGPSSCQLNFSGTNCWMTGYCDTGLGDACPREVSCLPNLARFLRPQPLREEWTLVRVTIRPQERRHRQS